MDKLIIIISIIIGGSFGLFLAKSCSPVDVINKAAGEDSKNSVDFVSPTHKPKSMYMVICLQGVQYYKKGHQLAPVFSNDIGGNPKVKICD